MRTIIDQANYLQIRVSIDNGTILVWQDKDGIVIESKSFEKLIELYNEQKA